MPIQKAPLADTNSCNHIVDNDLKYSLVNAIVKSEHLIKIDKLYPTQLRELYHYNLEFWSCQSRYVVNGFLKPSGTDDYAISGFDISYYIAKEDYTLIEIGVEGLIMNIENQYLNLLD